MRNTVTLRTLAVALAALLAVGFVFLRGSEAVAPKTVTAFFPRAISVYEGTDVRILGVSVGQVTAVTPNGESVRVDMEYDGTHEVPVDAKAVVVTPTLVSDRFVQLTPAYEGGPVMQDGAEIPLPKTAVPVELDRIYRSLNDLAETLGPNGLNKDGTLNNLIRAGANALDGQGKRANRALRELSKATQTLDDNSGDLFATVRQLGSFTTTLAKSDKLVRRFITDLAGVSEQLRGEKQEIRALVDEVARAMGTVKRFVKGNRKTLNTDLEKLTRVTRTIASETDSIDQALAVAPVAIGNLSLAFNGESQTIGSRIGIGGNVWDADGFLCSLVQQTNLPKASKSLTCGLLEGLLEPATDQLPFLPPRSGEGGGAPTQGGTGALEDRLQGLLGQQAPRDQQQAQPQRPRKQQGPRQQDPRGDLRNSGPGKPDNPYTSPDPPSLTDLLTGGAS